MGRETDTIKGKETFTEKRKRGTKSILIGIFLISIGLFLSSMYLSSIIEPHHYPIQPQFHNDILLSDVVFITALAGLISAIAGLFKAITGFLTVILAYMEKKKVNQINKGSKQYKNRNKK